MNKLITKNLFSKKLIFFLTKDTRILSFLVRHYTMKMDIIGYYLLPKSTVIKICSQNIIYVCVCVFCCRLKDKKFKNCIPYIYVCVCVFCCRLKDKKFKNCIPYMCVCVCVCVCVSVFCCRLKDKKFKNCIPYICVCVCVCVFCSRLKDKKFKNCIPYMCVCVCVCVCVLLSFKRQEI